MKKVSMQDVANRCGITKMQVSRVFTGKAGVSPETESAIRQAAAEMGFSYNPPINMIPEVEAQLKRGIHPSEVINSTGASRCLVYKVRRRLGMPKLKQGRKLGGKNRQSKWGGTIAAIREMKQSGMTYQQIADKFGVHYQHIQQLIRAQRGERCEHCGTTENLHAHHTNYVTNEAQTLCGSCHTKHHFFLKRVTRTIPVDLTTAKGVSV